MKGYERILRRFRRAEGGWGRKNEDVTKANMGLNARGRGILRTGQME